jgi:AcrR family transcriptional regulator
VAGEDTTVETKRRTSKAYRTRQALLDASLKVFEKSGLHDARVADISKTARVAHGTFYTYFESKADIFRTLMSKVVDDAYGPESGQHTPDLGTYRDIWIANKRFIDAYRQNSGVMGLIEGTATYDNELKAVRNHFRTLTRNGVRDEILRLQREGRAKPEIDATCTASALVAMRSNFAYFWIVMGEGEGEYDDEVVLTTLTEMWAAALGVLDNSTE